VGKVAKKKGRGGWNESGLRRRREAATSLFPSGNCLKQQQQEKGQFANASSSNATAVDESHAQFAPPNGRPKRGRGSTSFGVGLTAAIEP
jgi:hypothetical protein